MATIKPNWDKAPEWAKWWAMDKIGMAYWYEDKPIFSTLRGCWTYDNGKISSTEVVGWENSMEERPVPNPSKSQQLPFIVPPPPDLTRPDTPLLTASLETKLDRIIELLEIWQVVYVDSTQRIENNLAKLMPVPPGINPPEM